MNSDRIDITRRFILQFIAIATVPFLPVYAIGNTQSLKMRDDMEIWLAAPTC